jgi:hypothetical protein
MPPIDKILKYFIQQERYYMVIDRNERDPKGTIPIADEAMRAIGALPDKVRVRAILAVVRRMLDSLNHGIDALQTDAITAAENRVRDAEQTAADALRKVASIESILLQARAPVVTAPGPRRAARLSGGLSSGRPTPKSVGGKPRGRPRLPRDDQDNIMRAPEAQRRLEAAQQAQQARQQRKHGDEGDVTYQHAAEAPAQTGDFDQA